MSRPKWTLLLAEKMKYLKVDGLPNILRAPIILLKLTWLAILLTFVGVCAYLVVGSLKEYLKYEVTTKTRMLQEQQAIFPTFTICQVNPLSSDYATYLMNKANLTNIYELELYMKNTTGSYLSDSQKQKLSDLSMILQTCTIGNKACNASDFEWIWHPIYYNCYRFNTGAISVYSQSLIRTNIAGLVNFNFYLVLYSGLPNYWSNRAGAFRGFYLFLHNSTEYPFKTNAPPILLTPGYGSLIKVERSFYSQFNEWPYSYSECRVNEENELIGEHLNDPDELFERVRALNYTYSRDTCLMLCSQLQTTRTCGCNNYNISMRFEEHDLCLTSSQRECVLNSSKSQMSESCLAKCPLECLQSTLSSSLNYFYYPSSGDAYNVRFYSSPNFIKNHLNQSDFTVQSKLYVNLMYITIYYEDLSYLVIEEKAKTSAEDLLGKLGGHLHLFLGMSLLSFVEVVELIVLSFKLYIINFKKASS